MSKHEPRALIDEQGHICLEVNRSSHGVLFIELEACGFQVKREDVRAFDHRWTRKLELKDTQDFAPQRLAARFMNHAELIGIKDDARVYLETIAQTGQPPKKAPPRSAAPRPLPESMIKHQFKPTKPADFIVKIKPQTRAIKFQQDSLRSKLIEWLRARRDKSAALSAITAHFQRDMRGIVSQLEARGAVDCIVESD